MFQTSILMAIIYYVFCAKFIFSTFQMKLVHLK